MPIYSNNPEKKRLAYFLESVISTKEVYGLSDEEGWALLGDDDDTDILPLFPHAALAETFRKAADFEEYTVEKVDLEEFLEWLEEMETDGLMVAICPNTHLESAIVEPGQLKEDLQKALKNNVI